MNPEKIYVEVPGELGWREYRLHELVRLRRAGQLPRDAVFQNDQGEWRPIDELVDPIIAREMRAAGAGGIESSRSQVTRSSSGGRRRWVWAGLSILMLAVLLGVWPNLRNGFRAWTTGRSEERETVEWERRVRMEDVIKSGEVVPGMTLEEVRRSWGEPRKRKATADGVRQEWIYRQQTVIFENGVVKALEAVPSGNQ